VEHEVFVACALLEAPTDTDFYIPSINALRGIEQG